MRKSINSIEVAKPKGSFSQVLKVGDFVYISGQIGLNKNLEIAQTLEGQVEAIFENTNLLLSELKMNINQIVKTVVYATEDVDMEVVDKIFADNFKHPFPARSVVYINNLSNKDALIQISFDAIDLSAYEAVAGCDEEGCTGCEEDNCDMSKN